MCIVGFFGNLVLRSFGSPGGFRLFLSDFFLRIARCFAKLVLHNFGPPGGSQWLLSECLCALLDVLEAMFWVISVLLVGPSGSYRKACVQYSMFCKSIRFH